MKYLMTINTDSDCDIIYNDNIFSEGLEVVVSGDIMDEIRLKCIQFLQSIKVSQGRSHTKNMEEIIDQVIFTLNYSFEDNFYIYRGGNRNIEICNLNDTIQRIEI